jgi:hypothetical protein
MIVEQANYNGEIPNLNRVKNSDKEKNNKFG